MHDVTSEAGKVGWAVKQAEESEQGKLTTVMQEGLKGLQLGQKPEEENANE